MQKKSATLLREKGLSLNEIVQYLYVPKSTVREWVKNLSIDQGAQARLSERKFRGFEKGQEVLRRVREEARKKLSKKVNLDLKRIDLHPNVQKLLCAFLFWAEGSKANDTLRFTNSDPKMIKVFLKLLRNSFTLHECKFRVLIHIHSYHDENKVKDFWSKITDIPLDKFLKSYLKQNTGKNKKAGYMGTAHTYYYDAKIAQELHATYNAFTDLLR